ncbi:Uncharacterised protein [uncultured archaeon]|nr:Uncharacterised protein [uncultured archaeon]
MQFHPLTPDEAGVKAAVEPPLVVPAAAEAQANLPPVMRRLSETDAKRGTQLLPAWRKFLDDQEAGRLPGVSDKEVAALMRLGQVAEPEFERAVKILSQSGEAEYEVKGRYVRTLATLVDALPEEEMAGGVRSFSTSFEQETARRIGVCDVVDSIAKRPRNYMGQDLMHFSFMREVGAYDVFWDFRDSLPPNMRGFYDRVAFDVYDNSYDAREGLIEFNRHLSETEEGLREPYLEMLAAGVNAPLFSDQNAEPRKNLMARRDEEPVKNALRAAKSMEGETRRQFIECAEHVASMNGDYAAHLTRLTEAVLGVDEGRRPSLVGLIHEGSRDAFSYFDRNVAVRRYLGQLDWFTNPDNRELRDRSLRLIEGLQEGEGEDLKKAMFFYLRRLKEDVPVEQYNAPIASLIGKAEALGPERASYLRLISPSKQGIDNSSGESDLFTKILDRANSLSAEEIRCIHSNATSLGDASEDYFKILRKVLVNSSTDEQLHTNLSTVNALITEPLSQGNTAQAAGRAYLLGCFSDQFLYDTHSNDYMDKSLARMNQLLTNPAGIRATEILPQLPPEQKEAYGQIIAFTPHVWNLKEEHVVPAVEALNAAVIGPDGLVQRHTPLTLHLLNEYCNENRYNSSASDKTVNGFVNILNLHQKPEFQAISSIYEQLGNPEVVREMAAREQSTKRDTITSARDFEDVSGLSGHYRGALLKAVGVIVSSSAPEDLSQNLADFVSVYGQHLNGTSSAYLDIIPKVSPTSKADFTERFRQLNSRIIALERPQPVLTVPAKSYGCEKACVGLADAYLECAGNVLAKCRDNMPLVDALVDAQPTDRLKARWLVAVNAMVSKGSGDIGERLQQISEFSRSLPPDERQRYFETVERLTVGNFYGPMESVHGLVRPLESSQSRQDVLFAASSVLSGDGENLPVLQDLSNRLRLAELRSKAVSSEGAVSEQELERCQLLTDVCGCAARVSTGFPILSDRLRYQNDEEEVNRTIRLVVGSMVEDADRVSSSLSGVQENDALAGTRKLYGEFGAKARACRDAFDQGDMPLFQQRFGELAQSFEGALKENYGLVDGMRGEAYSALDSSIAQCQVDAQFLAQERKKVFHDWSMGNGYFYVTKKPRYSTRHEDMLGRDEHINRELVFGRECQADGCVEAALSAYSHIAQTPYRGYDVYADMGECRLLTGDREGAIRDFEQGIQETGDIVAFHHRARLAAGQPIEQDLLNLPGPARVIALNLSQKAGNPTEEDLAAFENFVRTLRAQPLQLTKTESRDTSSILDTKTKRETVDVDTAMGELLASQTFILCDVVERGNMSLASAFTLLTRTIEQNGQKSEDEIRTGWSATRSRFIQDVVASSTQTQKLAGADPLTAEFYLRGGPYCLTHLPDYHALTEAAQFQDVPDHLREDFLKAYWVRRPNAKLQFQDTGTPQKFIRRTGAYYAQIQNKEDAFEYRQQDTIAADISLIAEFGPLPGGSVTSLFDAEIGHHADPFVYGREYTALTELQDRANMAPRASREEINEAAVRYRALDAGFIGLADEAQRVFTREELAGILAQAQGRGTVRDDYYIREATACLDGGLQDNLSKKLAGEGIFRALELTRDTLPQGHERMSAQLTPVRADAEQAAQLPFKVRAMFEGALYLSTSQNTFLTAAPPKMGIRGEHNFEVEQHVGAEWFTYLIQEKTRTLLAEGSIAPTAYDRFSRNMPLILQARGLPKTPGVEAREHSDEEIWRNMSDVADYAMGFTRTEGYAAIRQMEEARPRRALMTAYLNHLDRRFRSGSVSFPELCQLSDDLRVQFDE